MKVTLISAGSGRSAQRLLSLLTVVVQNGPASLSLVNSVQEISLGVLEVRTSFPGVVGPARDVWKRAWSTVVQAGVATVVFTEGD